MDFIKIETAILIRGKSYLTFPHYKVLPFGNSDGELEGTDCDRKFWEWVGDLETGGTRIAKPYPTHVCELPNAPLD